MNSQTKTISQQAQFDAFSSCFYEMPSFDEAFTADSLRRFYQQQDQTNHTCFSLGKNEDHLSEKPSLSLSDDRETQASPLLRFVGRFNAENTFEDSHFASNLSPPIFFDDLEVNIEPSRNNFEELARYTQVAPQLKPFQQPAPIQAQSNPSGSKKVLEIKGINMTMCFGNFAVKGGLLPSSQIASRNCSASTVDSESEEPSTFEKLLRSKKIFKIERDVKAKASSPKPKNSPQPKKKAMSPQSKPTMLPFNTFQASNKDFMSQVMRQEESKAPVVNFLQEMQEKGYTAEQVMSEIQKFVQPNARDNVSAMLNF